MLKECEDFSRPVKVKEPQFKFFLEVDGISYQRRYELFCHCSNSLSDIIGRVLMT
jgi:Restriction endonuclease XhoI